MKSFLTVAGITTALLVAPLAAQAAPFGHGHQSNKPTVTASVVITKTQVRTGHNYNNYKAQRGHIIPLGQVVHELERKSGSTVTDITLSKNGKVYNFEGVNARGFIVHATADAYTGKVTSAKQVAYRPRYDPKGISINQLLTNLRNMGYQNFDSVNLNDGTGVYVVRGLNRRGQPTQIRVQAKTGRVLTQKATNTYYGPSYARAEYRDFDSFRSGLEKQRYSNFNNVTAYDDYYEAQAKDERGRKVALIISAFTGAILAANR